MQTLWPLIRKLCHNDAQRANKNELQWHTLNGGQFVFF